MDIKGLEKALKENIDPIFVNPETTSENITRLLSLLADHPDFQYGISVIREELAIPRDGFKGAQEAFNWESADKERIIKLRQLTSDLVGKFTINPVYEKDVRFFTEDYVVYPNRVSNLLISGLDSSEKHIGKGKKYSARIVRTESDIEINKYLTRPNSIYLEVNQNTTSRALVDAWKGINRHKNKSSFVVYKPEVITHRIWELSRQGLSDNEISHKIGEEFKKAIGYSSVPIYRKRYREALERLKLIEKE